MTARGPARRWLLAPRSPRYHAWADGPTDVRFRVSELDGQRLTHEAIEEDIRAVRGRQRVRVEALQGVREQHGQLRGALDQELAELQTLSAKLRAPGAEAGLWARIGERLSGLFAGERAERQSVEQLLRAQYETSLVCLREARELADRLEQIRADLYDEIDQLNHRIVASARYEDESSALLLRLREQRSALRQRLLGELSKVERREEQAQADSLRRQMAELSTQMQLHETRDERLGRLKQSTELLAQTIANLASDMRRYVGAATEKLDLVLNVDHPMVAKLVVLAGREPELAGYLVVKLAALRGGLDHAFDAELARKGLEARWTRLQT